MATGAWELAKDTVKGFIADEALSHGASIAYYTLFAVAPVLLIIIAIAGLVFGREAAEAAIVAQLSGLMGESTAKALEEILHKVGDREGGVWATVVGVGALILTATGVFGEVQSALNVIWKAKDDKAKERRSTLGRLARARAASLGLVVTSGFLITVSLATSAALEALSDYLARRVSRRGDRAHHRRFRDLHGADRLPVRGDLQGACPTSRSPGVTLRSAHS